MDSVKYKVLRDEYALGINTPNTTPEIKPIGGATLDDMGFEPIFEPIEGMIAEGLTVLVGRPWVGKGWLSLQMSLAIAEGKPFLGRKTTKCRTLCCSYQLDERTFAERLHMLDAGCTDDALIATDPPKGDDLISSLEGWLAESPDNRLVVIDNFYVAKSTLGERFFATQLKNLAAKYHAAIIVSVPSGKWREAEGADNALEGVADTLMTLKRKHCESKGVLKWSGRDLPHNKIKLHFDCGWTVNTEGIGA